MSLVHAPKHKNDSTDYDILKAIAKHRVHLKKLTDGHYPCNTCIAITKRCSREQDFKYFKAYF